MSNQVILWSMVLLPWLTLFFMKREDINRYMPVALFTIITSILIVEVGDTLKWWTVKETAYPLHNLSFLYGMNPVLTMWLLKFTYGRFGLFGAVGVVMDLLLAYVFLDYFLSSRDIYHYIGLTPFQTFLITIVHGFLIYGYQIWQERIFAQSEKTSFAANLQPVAAKPLPEHDDSSDSRD